MNLAGVPDAPYYEVHVANNYDYMDRAYLAGNFATAKEALAKCRQLVDLRLEECAEPGRTAAQILGCYIAFGDDPYLVCCDGARAVKFSAWDYAREKAGDFVNSVVSPGK